MSLVPQAATGSAAEETILKQFAGGLAKELMQALQQNGAMKQKDALANAHTGTLLHGPGGLFSTPGLSEAIISTHVRARGLGQLLPAYPSVDTDPRYGFITGFGAESGDEPATPCDDAPTGYIKSGTLTAKFGHVARDTKTIRTPDINKRIHRGEFTDLVMVGSILNPDSQGVYMPTDIDASQMINNVIRAEQVIAGVNMERKLSKLLWTGDSTVNTSGYSEFPGLDSQVATGQVDFETNTAMPAADSKVFSLGYQKLGDFDIVEPVEELEDYMFNLASDTGVDPVTWVVVVHPQMWRYLSEVWPTQAVEQPNYLTANTDARYLVDANQMVNERNAMRASMSIEINGRTYSVVTDHGIVQTDDSNDANLGTGEFASPMYFLPLSIVGNLPVLYWEYFNHQLSVSDIEVLRGNETFWSDGGRFLWSYDGKFTCFKLKMETDPRVILRTPHLAWKLEDIVYARNWAPLRDPDPDSNYWVNGGVSIRNVDPSGYHVW